ncbi:MAG: flagellar M-ring protein FliF [Anaerolineae bacterium]|nr:flagellar M-ring protein FliF [Anaerolineae bacterium]
MFTRFLNQFNAFWQRQNQTVRVVLITSVVVILIVIPVLITWASQPTYGVAFSELQETDAANIVDKLKAANIPYQMKGTSTILVPTDQVYDVRLMMAKEGLPTSSTVGFELFSGNTLGMTEFTQKVNYQRALEGELERTIGSLDAIKAVRVHIVTPDESLFASEQKPTTASITVEEKPGKKLDASQVRAIAFLVSNSVEGLTTENVVVVDTNGNLLMSGSNDAASTAASQVDTRRAAEKALASELQKKVKDLLDTALGTNRSVVQVSVALDWSEKEITKQEFDPTPQAVRSSQQLAESYSTDGQVTSGIPGATTNLPDQAQQAAGANGGNLVYSRTEITNNYEITTTESKEKVVPGDINNISLSVLVDGVSDQQQLTALQSAISAAVGINQDRGDIISVQSLDFDKTVAQQQADEQATSDRNALIITIAEIAAVVLVLGFLFWYVLRLLQNLKMASVEVWTPVLKPVAEVAALPVEQAPIVPMIPQPEPVIEEPIIPIAPPPVVAAPVVLPPPPKRKVEVMQTPEEEQMQKVVARLADDNPASVAEIIQLWLNEDKQRNV